MDEYQREHRLEPGNLEERAAVRFPLKLPVSVIVSDELYEATTENISSSGVLLKFDAASEPIEPGAEVDFLIRVAEGTTGPEETAAIHCQGRVVRTYRDENAAHAAAVINEYRFQSEEGAEPNDE